MLDKPKHLGLTYAEQFKEQSIVDAYVHRPPLPAPVFEQLLSMMAPGPQVVLDVGCGLGPVARHLVPLVDQVDAVDFSAAMIEAGRQLPNGDHPNLRWIESSVEEAPLRPPYALIVAASSLHWMEWTVVLPRFRDLLSPGGVLAIVSQSEARQPWHAEQISIIARYSTNQDFQPYNLIDELTSRGLFQQQGEFHTAPLSRPQSIRDYIESFHSRNGFSRDRMRTEDARAFDDAMYDLMVRHYPAGTVPLEISGHVIWGEPAPDGKGIA